MESWVWLPNGQLGTLNSAMVHGKHPKLLTWKCDDGNELNVKSAVKAANLPMGIDQAYLDAVKPLALAQVWVRFGEIQMDDAAALHQVGDLKRSMKKQN